jgi:hypothetical protein
MLPIVAVEIKESAGKWISLEQVRVASASLPPSARGCIVWGTDTTGCSVDYDGEIGKDTR